MGTQSRGLVATSSGSTGRRAINRQNISTHRPALFIGTGSGSFVDNATTGSTDGIHAYRALFEANRQRLYLDNVTTPLVDVTRAMNSTNNAFSVGANGSSFWLGDVNSILVTKPLTDDKALKLMTYLKERGGIV